jgi:hypothetical protein
MTTADAGVARTKPCRDCRREISLDAYACPHCGAPHPARETWGGWGFEYKSRLTIAGWPLQFGLCIAQGSGQHVMRVSELLARLGVLWQ